MPLLYKHYHILAGRMHASDLHLSAQEEYVLQVPLRINHVLEKKIVQLFSCTIHQFYNHVPETCMRNSNYENSIGYSVNLPHSVQETKAHSEENQVS